MNRQTHLSSYIHPQEKRLISIMKRIVKECSMLIVSMQESGKRVEVLKKHNAYPAVRYCFFRVSSVKQCGIQYNIIKMCKKIKLRISQKQIFRIFAKRCCISSLNLRMCKNNFAGRKLQKKTTIFAQVFGSKKPMERWQSGRLQRS